MKKVTNIRKVFSMIFIGFLCLLCTGGFTQTARADDGNGTATYSIHIVKYKQTDNQLKNSNLPKTPTGTAVPVGQAKDGDGNQLTAMTGVQYQIVQVQATNNSQTPYEPVPGAQTKTVTTDANGEASINLPEGSYRVTELAGNGVTTPAAPVIVTLPLTLQNGTVVNDVYLYPKSSVVTTTPTTPNTPKTPPLIPNTAGNINSPMMIYIFLGSVALVGIAGLFIKPRKVG